MCVGCSSPVARRQLCCSLSSSRPLQPTQTPRGNRHTAPDEVSARASGGVDSTSVNDWRRCHATRSMCQHCLPCEPRPGQLQSRFVVHAENSPGQTDSDGCVAHSGQCLASFFEVDVGGGLTGEPRMSGHWAASDTDAVGVDVVGRDQSVPGLGSRGQRRHQDKAGGGGQHGVDRFGEGPCPQR